jgi:putative component of membrane protein insertase Oxa1/YidC/SpoIIIJ protein YidD
MVFSAIVPFFSKQISTQTLSTLPRYGAAGLITAYQRYLSPLKGFSCAHRVLHQGESCSQYVKRTILEQGLSDALPQTRQRFRDCRSAYLTILASRIDSEEAPPEYEGAAAPTKKKKSCFDHPCCSSSNSSSCPSNSNSSDCIPLDILNCSWDIFSCSGNLMDFSACDAGACDAGACDAGACDAGACDVGSC